MLLCVQDIILSLPCILMHNSAREEYKREVSEYNSASTNN